MGQLSSPKLIEALRKTIERVECTEGVAPDDPALVHLKRILLKRIAELERPANSQADSQQAAPDSADSSQSPDGTIAPSPAADSESAPLPFKFKGV
jgi:hypothetical protein